MTQNALELSAFLLKFSEFCKYSPSNSLERSLTLSPKRALHP